MVRALWDTKCTKQSSAGVLPRDVPDSSHSTATCPLENPAVLLGLTRPPCHRCQSTEAHAAQGAWGVCCPKRKVGLLGRAGGVPRGQAHHPYQCSPQPRICRAHAALADNWLHNLIQAAAAEPAQAMQYLQGEFATLDSQCSLKTLPGSSILSCQLTCPLAIIIWHICYNELCLTTFVHMSNALHMQSHAVMPGCMSRLRSSSYCFTQAKQLGCSCRPQPCAARCSNP